MWQVSDNLGVGAFIDTYMHLVLLGIMKVVSTDMVMQFLTPKKKVASFVRTLNKKIDYVHSINASYMPIHKTCGEFFLPLMDVYLGNGKQFAVYHNGYSVTWAVVPCTRMLMSLAYFRFTPNISDIRYQK